MTTNHDDKVDSAVAIETDGTTVTVDAHELAPLLGIGPYEVPDLMRNGEITCLCEMGAGEDEGTLRIFFFYRSKRARIIVGPVGAIQARTVIDFGDRPLPQGLRRPSDRLPKAGSKNSDS